MADFKKLAAIMERLNSIKSEINAHTDWVLADVKEPPERQKYARKHNLDLQLIDARAGGLQVCLCHFVEASNEDGLPRFYLCPDGEPSALIEVLDDDAVTVLDYLAWALNDPEVFATAVGNADLLGGPNMRTRLGDPLEIHRTPLAWLKAGCRGCVVLNPEFAGYWLRKWCRRPILVEDLDHGREMKDILKRKRQTRTPLPEFNMQRLLVPAGGMARAA